MLVNALRGHMAEMGIIAPQGISRVGDLVAALMGEGEISLPSFGETGFARPRGSARITERAGQRGRSDDLGLAQGK